PGMKPCHQMAEKCSAATGKELSKQVRSLHKFGAPATRVPSQALRTCGRVWKRSETSSVSGDVSPLFCCNSGVSPARRDICHVRLSKPQDYDTISPLLRDAAEKASFRACFFAAVAARLAEGGPLRPRHRRLRLLLRRRRHVLSSASLRLFEQG